MGDLSKLATLAFIWLAHSLALGVSETRTMYPGASLQPMQPSLRRPVNTLLGIASALAIGAGAGAVVNCVANAFAAESSVSTWWTIAAAEGAAGGMLWAVIAYLALLWPLAPRTIVRRLPMLFGAALLGTLPAVFHSELYLFTAPACMVAACLWLRVKSSAPSIAV